MAITNKLARSAGVVMVAFVAANLAGLARQIIINRTFGATATLDAYFTAFGVPDLLFNLVAGGALGSAFIPVFAGLLAQEQRAAAWKLASAIITLLVLVLSAAGLVAGVAAPWLVRQVLAPGFAEDAVQVALTADLMRIMLISTVIFGVSGLVMGIHNAHAHFLLPALAPVFYNLGIIVGAVVLAPWLGIYGLAWGVVLGALAHLAVQLPRLPRYQGQIRPDLGRGNADVGQVLVLMAPRALGLAVWQINFWVNRAIASLLVVGSISAVTIAFQMFTFPLAVIAQAIATVVFPTFSAQVARQELGAMQITLAQSLRGVLYLSLPASVGMILLAQPIIAVLFEGREFTPEATALTAWALQWYAAGLVFHALLEIVTRGFYALKDTRTPVGMSVVAMVLNVVLSLTLVPVFTQVGWFAVGGLALANTLATGLEVGVLMVLLRRRLGGLAAGELARGSWGAVVATGLMALAVVGWLWVAPGWALVRAVVGVGLGGLVFYGVSYLLGSPESRLLPDAVLRRLARRAA